MVASLLQPFSDSITNICVLVLATFAITLIFKTSATTNFAQGSIAAFGCFLTSNFLETKGFNIWLALLVGMISGILLGLFIDIFIFRKGRNVNLVGKQIITMGIVSILGNGIPMIFKDADNTPTIKKLLELPNIKIAIGSGELTIVPHALVCLGITLLVLGVLFFLLRFSKWGLGVRTTASNEYVAQMMGVNTHVITAVTWAIAGGLGVLAAVIYVGFTGQITGGNPYFMTNFQVNAFLAGILGGFGTFGGPIVCAVLIQLFLPAVGLIAYIPGYTWILQWTEIITYVVIMIAILIKPTGIFGKKVVKKV